MITFTYLSIAQALVKIDDQKIKVYYPDGRIKRFASWDTPEGEFFFKTYSFRKCDLRLEPKTAHITLYI